MSKSYAAVVAIAYDDAAGSPVDITTHVLTINDIEISNVLERTDPFGVGMAEHSTTGKGEVAPIELGGIYEDTDADSPDVLFADRVPEAPSVAARTLTITWRSGRTTSIETKLGNYKRTPNRETGLSRWMARLQPSGTVTEVGVT